MPSTTLPAEGPSPVVLVAVVLLGVALLAHPLYLVPHYGQTAYHLSDVEAVGDADGSTDAVTYRELPPSGREAFDAARAGGRGTLWTGEDDAAIEALQRHSSVAYRGTPYDYRLFHSDRVIPFAGLLRGLLTALGAASLVVGVFGLVSGTWRPVTPRRSLWVPAVVALGLVGMRLYDVGVSGASGGLSLRRLVLPVVSLTGVAFCCGSVLRRRGRRALPAVVAVGVVLLASGALATGAPPVVGLVVGGVAVVGGTPWAALGYWLTPP